MGLSSIAMWRQLLRYVNELTLSAGRPSRVKHPKSAGGFLRPLVPLRQ